MRLVSGAARRETCSRSPAGDSERNPCAAVDRSARGLLSLRVNATTRRPAMAESIPKAKSAYAFFQAAMNKQMVGVPLG